jgi:hypothetical protein
MVVKNRGLTPRSRSMDPGEFSWSRRVEQAAGERGLILRPSGHTIRRRGDHDHRAGLDLKGD